MTGADDRQISARLLVVPEIVTFPARVDVTNAVDVGIALIGAFGPRVAVVIADLTATEVCDAAGVCYLLVGNEVAAETGAELRLVITSEAVLRAIAAMRADRNLHIYGSMSQALSGAPGSSQQEAQGRPSDSTMVKPGAEMTG